MNNKRFLCKSLKYLFNLQSLATLTALANHMQPPLPRQRQRPSPQDKNTAEVQKREDEPKQNEAKLHEPAGGRVHVDLVSIHRIWTNSN